MTSPLSPRTLAALRAVVGDDRVTVKETDRLIYSVDGYWMPQMWLDRGHRPPQADAIVYPGTPDEIAKILAI